MKEFIITQEQTERAVLVGLITPEQNEAQVKEYLDELAFLAETAGIEPVRRFTQKADMPHAVTFVGSGKLRQIGEYVAENEIGIVVFDDELSAKQLRNIEKELKVRILDRTNLILDIFAKRAQTAHAKTQVELAQYRYMLPRLTRLWTHLERQRGGVGMRGPGETQLETDRRLIAQKITALKKRLEAVRRQRATRRKAREHGSLPTFALVGYTNTGKSSLFNRLTKADVLAKNQLFATLDTTARRLYLNPSASIILTDTVGFVRDLPHSLVAAFSATLEETALADVLLHVVDAAHPEHERQIDDVNEVLREIGAGGVPQIVLYNKTDLLPPEERRFGILRDTRGRAVAANISVKTGEGLDALREILAEHAVSDGLKNQNTV